MALPHAATSPLRAAPQRYPMPAGRPEGKRCERRGRNSDGTCRQRSACCLGDSQAVATGLVRSAARCQIEGSSQGSTETTGVHGTHRPSTSTIASITGLRRNEHLRHESVADPCVDRWVDPVKQDRRRAEGPLCETGRTPPPSIVERVDDPRCHERMGTGGGVDDGVGEPVVLVAEARRNRATSPNVAPLVGRGTTGTPAAAARSGAHEAADGRATATPSTSTVGGASPPDTRAQRCRRRRRRPGQDRPTTPSVAPNGPAVPEQAGIDCAKH